MVHPLMGHHILMYWRWKEIDHCFHLKAGMPAGLTSQSYTFRGIGRFKTLSDSTLSKWQICGTLVWVSVQTTAMCPWLGLDLTGSIFCKILIFVYCLSVERIIMPGLYQCCLSFLWETLASWKRSVQFNIAASALSEQVEKVLLEIQYY